MMRMKYFSVYFIGFFILTSVGCNTPNEDKEIQSLTKYNEELLELKEYFKIPGMAVLVKKDHEIIYEKYLGKSDLQNNVAVDSVTIFPIASLTKMMTGVALMQLQEQDRLSLDTPVTTYFPESTLSDSIQVKHILSHTSQGKPGENFYYSSRFSALTKVLERESGSSFKEYVEKNIFQKLGMKHTFLLKDSTQIRGKKIAKPYMLEDGVQPGFIDYGFSASAGVVSTVRDLKLFDDALDNNVLISSTSKNEMFTSFQPNLPYGYGVFSQHFEGKKIIWGYGQYDCYSSLYLKIPEDNLTLILLANNNLMSDPARLIYGNITSSLFAMSFLKNIVWDHHNLTLFENQETLQPDKSSSLLVREKLRAQALAASFMARFDLKEMEKSKMLLNKIFSDYPNYQKYGDLALLHNLMFLKEVAFHRELGAFKDFDAQIEIIGQNLLKIDPNNPYANYYLANFYGKARNADMARKYFEKIVNAKNFSSNWYTKEARLWLKNMK